MRLQRQRDGGLRLRLSAAERPLLSAVLERFPAVPEHHSRLSRDAAWPDARTQREAESLRRESWADHVAETGRLLSRLHQRLTEPPPGESVSLRLEADTVDLLLQVLNDVRVGSWVQLGRPDPLPRRFEGSGGELSSPASLMELAGLFESLLLQALELPEAGTAEP